MDFLAWLALQGISANTAASVVNRVKRLAGDYGDLRQAHDRDGLAQILIELTYGMEDERRGRPNPSQVPIKGDLRTGLASLKNAATLFGRYLEDSQSAHGEGAVGRSLAPRRKASRSKVPIVDDLPNGPEILSSVYQDMKHNPAELIARSAIWAHPTVVRALMSMNQYATWFPTFRRKKANEARGAVMQGVRLDDNSYANQAIKLATFGGRRALGFNACHIWPGTCYDPRYHTSIANLILLPSSIAGLTDHDPEVVAVIQYRAFELYGWKPDECTVPNRPTRYPDESIWRQIPRPTPAVERAVAKRTNNG